MDYNYTTPRRGVNRERQLLAPSVQALPETGGEQGLLVVGCRSRGAAAARDQSGAQET